MVYAEPRRHVVDDYVYYHEVMAMRQALLSAELPERAEILGKLQGERWKLSWFDAVSSQVNDLYTHEELYSILTHLGFEDIRRTAPEDRNMNITATKKR